MHMNGITPEEVKKIAGLARLKLSDEEVARAASDLSGVLSHFSAIQDIDTASVPPAEDNSGLKNVSRKDEAKPEILGSVEDIMKNVPRVQDGYVQVAGVFSDQETL